MGFPTRFDRSRVLDAAAVLVDEHGYQNLTLAMLAADLGVRSQSLYAHVDGIEGLRDGLALRAQGMLADDLRDAAVALTGPDALRSVVRALRRFADEHPGMYQASLRTPVESPEMAAANLRTTGPMMAVLRSFGLEGEDLEHHYRVIWSSVHGFVALGHAGLHTWQADPEVTFDLILSIFVSDLERRVGRSW